MPPKQNYRDEHLALWKSILRHGGPIVFVVGIVLSFLYDVGFVDIPATRAQLSAMDRRMIAVEAQQDGIGSRLRMIENTTSGMASKVDDTKINVDRLVGALIDDGMSHRQPQIKRR